MTVLVSHVERAAIVKGNDYRNECFAKGILSPDGASLEMTDLDFQAIREKFSLRLGDKLHALLGPVGRVIQWPCLKGDGTTDLKAESPCEKARQTLNKL